MKKVLIISTSIRAGSNSEILARELEKGAKDNVIQAIIINGIKFIIISSKIMPFKNIHVVIFIKNLNGLA